MKQWQQVIYNAVKPGVTDMARSLKASYPQAGVSLNFNLQWPSGFKPGEDARIPITLPSVNGPLHIGSAVVSIDNNSKILGVGVEAMDGSIGVYNPSVVSSNVETITGTMDRVSDFLGDFNKVLGSSAMQMLLTPKIGGIPTGLNLSAGIASRSPMVKTFGLGITAPGAGPTRAWNTIKDSALAAEQARAKTIKTPDGQAEFIEQALKSPSKAPHWYYMLGGNQKDVMKEKIKKAYIEKCGELNKTIPPSVFLHKLTELMFSRNQIAPYCEKNADFIEGTLGQCQQRMCPVYDPNCKKLSTRLNISN